MPFQQSPGQGIQVRRGQSAQKSRICCAAAQNIREKKRIACCGLAYFDQKRTKKAASACDAALFENLGSMCRRGKPKAAFGQVTLLGRDGGLVTRAQGQPTLLLQKGDHLIQTHALSQACHDIGARATGAGGVLL
jgi:hypothetical protein